MNPEHTPASYPADDELLTVAEIASRLKLNQQAIRNWIDQERLPAVRIGRRVRIKRADFAQLLTTAAGPATPPRQPPAYTAEQFWDGDRIHRPRSASKQTRLAGRSTRSS